MTEDHRLQAGPAAFADLFDNVSWLAIVGRGVIGILFGLLALTAPVATALSLLLVFSIYLMADGFLAIASAIKAARRKAAWGLLAVEGVVNIIASVVIFMNPKLGAAAFVLIIAIWSLIAGVVKLIAAFRRQPLGARGWLAFSGLISLVFGLLLLAAPLIGAVVLTWWLGVYGVVFGVALLILGFQVRSARKKADLGTAATA